MLLNGMQWNGAEEWFTKPRGLWVNPANTEHKNKKGETALMRAASKGFNSIVRLLVERGAKVDTTNEITECVALTYAAVNNELEAAKILIENNAVIQHKNKFGETALMFAAAHNAVYVMSLLMENDVNVNATDNKQCAALFHTADVTAGKQQNS